MKLYPPCTLSEPDGLDLTGGIARQQNGVLGQDDRNIVVEMNTAMSVVDRQQRVLLSSGVRCISAAPRQKWSEVQTCPPSATVASW